MQAASKRVALTAIYNVFFWIGLFSFGGGLVPWIHREVVTVRGWMRDEDFLPYVAVAQILPGVNSTNMAIFVGQRLRGVVGATTAVVAMLTGPFLAMLLAATFYQKILSVPPLHAAMAGVAAAAIGMLLRMGILAVATASRSVASVAVMIAIFVAVGVMHWPLLWVVAAATPVSVALAWPRKNADA